MPINAQIEHFDEEGLKELFEAALEKVTFINHDYPGILRDRTIDEKCKYITKQNYPFNEINHWLKSAGTTKLAQTNQ